MCRADDLLALSPPKRSFVAGVRDATGRRCDFCRYVAVFFRRSGAASAAVGILIIGSSRAI